MMAKFSQAVRAVLMATLIAGLFGCGGGEKKAAPAPAPSPLTVGGSVTGLAGGDEVVLQLNGSEDLAVKADGKFKFPKALTKGGAYDVTVKTSPIMPVKQICTVTKGSGKIADAAVNSVAVNCVTNTSAVGGTVSGLVVKGKKAKGLVLELKGVKEVEITKNGNFVFPEVRLPDGSDYNVAIKSTPAGQKCEIEAIATAPDSDTLNIVAVKCKKGRN
jgi:hypothetical protein